MISIGSSAHLHKPVPVKFTHVLSHKIFNFCEVDGLHSKRFPRASSAAWARAWYCGMISMPI